MNRGNGKDLCMSLKFYKCHSLFFPSKFRPLGSWMYNIPACGRTPTVPSRVRGTPWSSPLPSTFYPPHTHIPLSIEAARELGGGWAKVGGLLQWCFNEYSGSLGRGDTVSGKVHLASGRFVWPYPEWWFLLFYRNEYLIFQKIIKLEYDFPEKFFPKARDLVEKLLVNILHFLLVRWCDSQPVPLNLEAPICLYY